MEFDQIIDRRNTHSVKWDMMEPLYGVSPQDGLSMWVADMDFQSPECVLKAAQDYAQHGIFGYFGDDRAYKEAIIWWMKNRHGWQVDPTWIFTTHGLVNGTAMCVESFTKPDEAVMLMTPVYHSFAKVIRGSGRRVHESPLKIIDGEYRMDFETWDEQLEDDVKMLILCSPHNPGGRVWRESELREVAQFCQRHNILLVSDDIHHDIVLNGAAYQPIGLVAPEIKDRLIMMTAASKTFNIAGGHVGNVIIENAELRRIFDRKMTGLGMSPNAFGLHLTTAAYSPEGAAWVDDMVKYIAGNAALFDAAIAQIPGAKSMPLEATYLAWVDFSGCGLKHPELLDRVQNTAKIAANHGESFGLGGESFLRFNLGTPRVRVDDACNRLVDAFKDLQ